MSNLKSDNYYEILGVNKNDDEKKKKTAYKKLAMKYHLDKNNEEGAADNFKIISEAYGILSDKNKREQYDRFGKDGLNDDIVNINPDDIFKALFSELGGMNDIFSQNMSFPGGNGFISITTINGGQPNVRVGHDPFSSIQFTNNPFGNQPFGNQPFGIKSNNNEKKELLLRTKQKIVVKNLVNKKNYNNKIGYIESYDNQKEKYIIKLKNGDRIMLYEKNIQQIVPVTFIDIDKLNDCNGEIIGIDNEKKCYKVIIDNKLYLINPENVILKKNTIVYLKNKKGIILEYNLTNKKYLTSINDKKILVDIDKILV